MSENPTAYVVDDEESIRSLWQWLLATDGIAARTYASAAAFLQDYRRGDAGCLVLDVRLPGMTGPELQDYLRREGIEIPIVFMSAHGDVRIAVNAMKGGAVDFIQKPFDYREALAIVRRAFEQDGQARHRQAKRAVLAERFAALTERERGVLQCIIEGKANKVIATELDISIKTVEAHRAKVMEKMGVDSVAELVQCVLGFSLMEAPGGGG
jgi:two-component system response regulator FixJ